MNIVNGIPTRDQVLEVLDSELYKSQRNFNNEFLEKNDKILLNYKNKWVSNPLWQWSRIYEYPFVENGINAFKEGRKALQVLDAGSGITFLPFKLSRKFEVSEIICLDYDESLINTYDEINDPKVKLLHGALDTIKFKDNSFDIIYCVSVLEHTDNYANILREFKRVIKNNGLLILTFDVGLSNRHKLNLDNSNRLLSLITEIIIDKENALKKISLIRKDIWTTKQANKLDKALLPYPIKSFSKRMKNIILGRDDFPNLTFYVFSSLVVK